MGQSTSLDFLARISCLHFSLWMHCLLVTKKCCTWLGRGVSNELVAIYIYIHIYIYVLPALRYGMAKGIDLLVSPNKVKFLILPDTIQSKHTSKRRDRCMLHRQKTYKNPVRR